MTNITGLIDRLRAQLANLQDVPDSYVPLMLSRADAKNLLRILEFVEAMKIETMRDSEYYDGEFDKLVNRAKEADRRRP